MCDNVIYAKKFALYKFNFNGIQIIIENEIKSYIMRALYNFHDK